MIGFGSDKNQILTKFQLQNLDKVSASKFGTDFSNWFGLAKFCKVRQGEVSLHTPGSHPSGLKRSDGMSE